MTLTSIDPPSGKRTDNWSELLTRVGTYQDQQAFKALFEHFGPLIKGFCLSNINQGFGPDAAEEVVQEVMFKVWQKAPTFDANKAAASTWIYTVMRNARIDLIRRNKRHSSEQDTIDVDDIWDEDNSSGPVVQFQKIRDEQLVRESFGALPQEQRHAITEVYMKGKSHSEVAEESGLPLGTIKSRVRMGLQKIQSFINTKNTKVSS